MNSLFNYELDERQIRLTLHDAELECSDASWTEFDNEYPADHSSHGKTFNFNLPKINLNINRNVLVPIFFILVLGGVSAIMFKFIDFKTNKSVEAERTLESDHALLNTEKKVSQQPVKKATATSLVVVPEVKKDTLVVANTTFVKTSSLSAAQKIEPSKQQYTEPVIVQKNNSLPDSAGFNPQSASLASDNKEIPPAHTIIYKKRRKKLVVEQVETIKAPSLLSAQTAPEEEPELKIKQN